MQKLFPDVEPFETFFFDVSHGHSLYVERTGNPNGLPVLYLHGGPGGGLTPDFRRMFNPEHFHIIMFDQRGAGQSTPHASLENNTLPLLIEDVEAIRSHLGIDEWLVTGGSWGSTLSIAYAKAYPQRVTELILRGLFLCRPSEIHWMYQYGASEIFPDIWERFIAPIPKAHSDDLLSAYYGLLTSDDPEIRLMAAKAWSCWEFALMSLQQDRDNFSHIAEKTMLAMARIECHFFINNIFLPDGATLLDDIEAISHIPTTLIQGRYDVVCPVRTAWDIHRALPHSDLFIIPNAGHSFSEPSIVDRFVQTTNNYAAAHDSLNMTQKFTAFGH